MPTTIRESHIRITREEAARMQEIADQDTKIEVAVSDLLALEGPRGEKTPSSNVDVVIRVEEGANPEILSNVIDFMNNICSIRDSSTNRASRFSDDCYDVYDLLINSMPSTGTDGIENIRSDFYHNIQHTSKIDYADFSAELTRAARFGVNIYPAGSRVYFKKERDGLLFPHSIVLSRDTTIRPRHDERITAQAQQGVEIIFKGLSSQMESISGDERYDIVAGMIW